MTQMNDIIFFQPMNNKHIDSQPGQHDGNERSQ